MPDVVVLAFHIGSMPLSQRPGTKIKNRFLLKARYGACSYRTVACDNVYGNPVNKFRRAEWKEMAMADIISISTATRRPRKPDDAHISAGGPAQILFFTGVRYERTDAAKTVKARKRKVSAVAGQDSAINS